MTRRGYADPAYAAALGPRVVDLPRAGAALLARPTEDGGEDATGPYPLLCCGDWAALAEDLAALDGSLASVTAVADPLGGWSEAELRAAFPALARPFKAHFVVDLGLPVEETATAHHRRDARRGLRRVAVERLECGAAARDGSAADPALDDAWRADWRRLYAELIGRHAIDGPAAFEAAVLDAMWRVPGMRAYRARKDGATVAMQLWLLEGGVARYHLAAQDAVGYRESAAYALTWTALHDLAAEGLEVAHLGAAAGGGADGSDATDGLTRFKRGWSTGTRTAWLCGRIGDAARYAALARARGADPDDTTWFPVYRRPARP